MIEPNCNPSNNLEKLTPSFNGQNSDEVQDTHPPNEFLQTKHKKNLKWEHRYFK